MSKGTGHPAPGQISLIRATGQFFLDRRIRRADDPMIETVQHKFKVEWSVSALGATCVRRVIQN
jgi:hypothetical protein